VDYLARVINGGQEGLIVLVRGLWFDVCDSEVEGKSCGAFG
jgi:hypothetical protein